LSSRGSINLAYESERMAVPDAKFLGLRVKHCQRCGLSDATDRAGSGIAATQCDGTPPAA
jgi:DNA topoisomerase VI subunit A